MQHNPSKQDREEFESFCCNATDAQLRGIYEKEKTAKRYVYVNIVVNEAARRNVWVKEK